MRLPILPVYRRIAVIMNPRARGGRRFRDWQARLETVLRDLEIQFDRFETRGPGDATRISRELRSSCYDMLLVCGGDGTVNEVVNGWLGMRTPIGVLPLGTSNILARVLGIRRHLERACIQIFYGRPRPIRVGRANDRYFVLMAGVGLDAEIVHATAPDAKFRWGRWAYAWQTLVQAWRDPDYRLRITLFNRTPTTLEGALVVATLVPNYAGFMRIIPRSWFARAPMWVSCYARHSIPAFLRYFLFTLGGWQHRLPDVHVQPVHALEVVATGRPVAFQVDGEFAGWTPVRITLTEDYVNVIGPMR